jgi:hypothetical protein
LLPLLLLLLFLTMQPHLPWCLSRATSPNAAAAAAAAAAGFDRAAASTLVPEQGNFFQRQAMAVPEDMSDPLLKRWKKPDTNPFLVQAS